MTEQDFKQSLQRFNELELKMQTFSEMVKGCNQKQATILKKIEAIENALIKIENTALYAYKGAEITQSEIANMKEEIRVLRGAMES